MCCDKSTLPADVRRPGGGDSRDRIDIADGRPPQAPDRPILTPGPCPRFTVGGAGHRPSQCRQNKSTVAKRMSVIELVNFKPLA